MRRVAWACLSFDRGKLVAAIGGVAFATLLVISQLGIYVGFLRTSSAPITQLRGDLWVMSRGTNVFEFPEPLPRAVASIGHPCITGVRGVVAAYSYARRHSGGGAEAVEIIGAEASPGRVFPWAMKRGLPSDVGGPRRVAVDETDLARLGITGSPIGREIEIGEQSVYVAATTDHLRAFGMAAYVFTNLETGRVLTGLGSEQAHYWIVDLADSACVAEVRRSLEDNRDVQAIPTRDFARMTEKHWVDGAGAGAALGLAAILGLVVGIAIVGQTLYGIIEAHRRELATLKAVGASPEELVQFVLWQVLVLLAIGASLGVLLAGGIASLAPHAGISVAFSPGVLGAGLASIVVTCLVASLGAVRAAVRLEPAEVFR